MGILETIVCNLQIEIDQKKRELEEIKKTSSLDGIYYYKLGVYDAYKYAQDEINKEIDKEKFNS